MTTKKKIVSAADSVSNFTETEKIAFKLSDKRSVWRAQAADGSKLTLSRFSNDVYGEVSKNGDPLLYEQVVRAISLGVLITTDPKNVGKKEVSEVIDLVNIPENNLKQNRVAADTLKNLSRNDLLSFIEDCNDYVLISKMIELESRGKNKSRAKRTSVIDALKLRLNEIGSKIDGGAIIEYNESSEEEYKVIKK